MADIVDLPFFTAKGNWRGIVPDTLDIGYRVDEFRPWAEVTLTPLVASAGDVLEGDTPELRLTALATPITVLLVPTVARIETGVLRFAREPVPALDAVPPSLEQQAEQQAAEGVPLLAMGPELELGTRKLVYRVGFGPFTILGRNYTFGGFYFAAPTVVLPQPWWLEVEGATGGTFDLTVTVGAGAPATAAAVPFNATPAALVTAIEALPNVGAGEVTATGASLAAGVRLEFLGTLAGQRVRLSANTAALVGGAGLDLHELAGATVDLTTVTRWSPAAL